MTKSKPQRGVFSYSLRRLMLLFVAASIPLALVTNRARKQKAAVEALRAAGAVVWYDYELDSQGKQRDEPRLPGPRWLRDWLGVDYVARVRGVSFSSQYDPDRFATGRSSTRQMPSPFGVNLGFGGEVGNMLLDRPRLDLLAPLPGIRELDLSLTATSDSDLGQLEQFPSIESLDLSWTGASGDGLQALTALPRLKKLRLSGCWLRDSAYEHLRECRSLVELDLSNTNLSDRRLLRLAPLVRLQSLILLGGNVTDAGLAALEAMGELESLDLSDTLVTSIGAAAWERIPPIRYLSVRNSLFNDAGLTSVARLEGLESLDARYNAITLPALVELLALPKLSDLEVTLQTAPVDDDECRSECRRLALDWITRSNRFTSRAEADRRATWLADAAVEDTEFRAALEWSQSFDQGDIGYVESWLEASWDLDHQAAESLFRQHLVYGLGSLVEMPTPLAVGLDELFAASLRKRERPAEWWIEWSKVAQRQRAQALAREFIESQPPTAANDFLRQVIALENPAASCLAAAVAKNPGAMEWSLLAATLPPPEKMRAVQAWQAVEPENAVPWSLAAIVECESAPSTYFRYFPFDDRRNPPRWKQTDEEALEIALEATRCEQFRLGAPQKLDFKQDSSWFGSGWGLCSAPIDQCKPLTDFFSALAIHSYDRLTQYAQRLHADGRRAEAEECRATAEGALRRFITAPPNELHTILAGCDLLLNANLNARSSLARDQVDLQNHWSVRFDGILELRDGIYRLLSTSPHNNDPQIVESWFRGLDDCTDETAVAILAAIEAWDRKDQALLAASVEELEKR